MEEGGGIAQRSNSRDHLATRSGRESRPARENSKQWLTSGFNGFGQLVTSGERKLQQFKEFKTDITSIGHNSHQSLMACSWSYSVSASECFLQLQGLISDSPHTVKTITTENVIKSLATCDKFCLVLLENGKVFKLLSQQFAQLEEVKFQANHKLVLPQKRSIFNNYKSEDNYGLRIDLVACGKNIMVAVGNSNEVFSGTTEIHQFPTYVRLKQLVCGFEHALLLTSNGDVYSWGNGLRGQLGQEILKIEEKPTLLEALAGIKITYVTSSGWHSAAISAFGDLYTWGFNTNGQLGLRIYKNEDCTLKEPAVYPLPQLIDLPICCSSQNVNKCESSEQNCFPIKVVAGARHTILFMNCGSLYASGWNAYGQLGLKTIKSFCDTFQYVLKVDKASADTIEIVCGIWCTLIGIQSQHLSFKK